MKKKIKLPEMPKFSDDIGSDTVEKYWALEIAAGVFLSLVSILIAIIA